MSESCFNCKKTPNLIKKLFLCSVSKPRVGPINSKHFTFKCGNIFSGICTLFLSLCLQVLKDRTTGCTGFKVPTECHSDLGSRGAMLWRVFLTLFNVNKFHAIGFFNEADTLESDSILLYSFQEQSIYTFLSVSHSLRYCNTRSTCDWASASTLSSIPIQKSV